MTGGEVIIAVILAPFALAMIVPPILYIGGAIWSWIESNFDI